MVRATNICDITPVVFDCIVAVCSIANILHIIVVEQDVESIIVEGEVLTLFLKQLSVVNSIVVLPRNVVLTTP